MSVILMCGYPTGLSCTVSHLYLVTSTYLRPLSFTGSLLSLRSVVMDHAEEKQIGIFSNTLLTQTNISYVPYVWGGSRWPSLLSVINEAMRGCSHYRSLCYEYFTHTLMSRTWCAGVVTLVIFGSALCCLMYPKWVAISWDRTKFAAFLPLLIFALFQLIWLTYGELLGVVTSYMK